MNAKLSAAKLAQQIGVSGRNVEVNIKKLKERGIWIRCGSPKSGYWKLSGWIDIADQIEQADRKGKKKHGELF